MFYATIFSNIVPYNSNIFYLKQVQYNEYWVRTVDIESLVLWHQGISGYSAEYEPIRLRLFMGFVWITISFIAYSQVALVLLCLATEE